MKKATIFFLFMALLTGFAQATLQVGEPVMPVVNILKDYETLSRYYVSEVRLWDDFKGYDASMHPLKEADFLKQNATGKYLPLRLVAKDGSLIYKLYPAKLPAESIMRALLEWKGGERYKFYLMEGKKLPDFNFTDINGKLYNAQSTKNKLVVLKFWFISCKPCAEEMPGLNRMVAGYKDRKDILFVSLALDPKKDLQAFLKTTTFSYAVVPDKDKYLREVLKIDAYPTHMIVDKQGTISKVLGTADELVAALNKEAAGKWHSSSLVN
ncbi:TlpA family protein disulfide reductase [Hufsiella ginkgonis]|uniref:Redoxin domain-containing protein n=1 Tax=Hufsiella ginkgonis TaxID=2695274 RepID=A0A7K1XWU0_9SPHI|nr:TlpA disulfide reductase family protein [Hufsiella ginkgonis]MXV15239.1 redoxin domain-containing protein [Hufsiella ginkgonis]